MDTIEADAREFGLHVRQGGWRLGLLVARNVERGVGTGGNPSISRETDDGKWSATRYAKVAGTSPARVLRHLDAWDMAAADGVVPEAFTLSPADEPPLDAEVLPPWEDYYSVPARVDAATNVDLDPAATFEGETFDDGFTGEYAPNNKPADTRSAAEAAAAARPHHVEWWYSDSQIDQLAPAVNVLRQRWGMGDERLVVLRAVVEMADPAAPLVAPALPMGVPTDIAGQPDEPADHEIHLQLYDDELTCYQEDRDVLQWFWDTQSDTEVVLRAMEDTVELITQSLAYETT